MVRLSQRERIKKQEKLIEEQRNRIRKSLEEIDNLIKLKPVTRKK